MTPATIHRIRRDNNTMMDEYDGRWMMDDGGDNKGNVDVENASDLALVGLLLAIFWTCAV
jgi:hypothetical protein